MINMDYIRKLLVKKEQEVNNDLDNQKVQHLKGLLKQDDIFFNIDLATAVGILSFLGIPEDKIRETYMNLISPENYINTTKPYFTIINR